MISELLRNRILLSLVTLLAMANPAMARLISASETWLATNSPYTIAEDIVIEPGSMLTIQPGVVVNTTFDAPGCGNNILAVEFFNSGELSLSGTPLAPVSIGPATASYPAPSVRSSSGATLTARNLFLTGDLMLDPGATYVATPTERISVQGNVALGGALVLTGVAATTRGQSYILIEKTTLGPVSGTFSGMAEGAVFRMGGASWVIT